MRGNEKLKGHLLILAANVLFAINMPISKFLLPSHLEPEALTVMRMAFACVMFWICSLFVPAEKVPLKDMGTLFICALCGVGFNQGLFIWGLNITSPVDASIIATAVPIFVMILAAFILKEPITRMKAFGVLLGITGAVSLILQSANSANQTSSLAGNLLITFSGFIYSVYLVLSKPLTMKYSAITMMKWMFLFSTLSVLPFTFGHIASSPAFHRTVLDYQELGAIFFVLFGATFVPYLLIPMSLKRIRPTTVSMYNYVQPIIASFITVLIGQDTFSITKLLSALFVFVGVYLVTQSKSREDMEKEKAAKTTKK
ncbi:DMT family transporter [Parabacteroides bouchesdurhonensis]|uniref:DMT family transporter n=1 Tax=Parabacteroides bouchesdurhonensis TaxID=1936995 RepID=UPI000E491598|nr:DMT family transporter [Parabacteroides bouchesdurhonensis]RHJ92526.1 EamA/RhaT family transporter [Bacteroides sp. AM07-16]